MDFCFRHLECMEDLMSNEDVVGNSSPGYKGRLGFRDDVLEYRLESE